MQCNEFRDHLLDLAIGAAISADVQEHARSCQACASEVTSLQRTMSLLDEWQAPQDTSPYFMTRLRARIREEAERAPTAGWLSWFRKPALALSTAILLVASISLLSPSPTEQHRSTDGMGIKARVSSPVNDLTYLDDNKDLLANFELLDDAEAGTPQ